MRYSDGAPPIMQDCTLPPHFRHGRRSTHQAPVLLSINGSDWLSWSHRARITSGTSEEAGGGREALVSSYSGKASHSRGISASTVLKGGARRFPRQVACLPVHLGGHFHCTVLMERCGINAPSAAAFIHPLFAESPGASLIVTIR